MAISEIVSSFPRDNFDNSFYCPQIDGSDLQSLAKIANARRVDLEGALSDAIKLAAWVCRNEQQEGLHVAMIYKGRFFDEVRYTPLGWKG